MRQIRRPILALSVLFALTGCAELGARAVTSGLEATDAAKDYIDERTDRREVLRQRLYGLEDQLIACYTAQAAQSADLDCEAVKQAVEQASAYIEQVYPDLAKAIAEIRAVRQAIRGVE